MKKRKGEKSVWKKIWWFIWQSDSIWSWIVDLLLLWIFVKFIFIPLLGLALSSRLPSVIVESSSMEHNFLSQPGISCIKQEVKNFNDYWQECGNFYEQKDITKGEFLTFKFNNGFNKGDIIIVKGYRDEKPKIGDVIVYDANQALPIIHRVIAIHNLNGNEIYETKGDYNDAQLDFEKSLNKEQIIGKAVGRIPKAGWVKIFVVKILLRK